MFKSEKYGSPSLTHQGVLVKSKAERILADYFTRKGIEYQYEPRIYAGKIIHPDFYLPEHKVYVEYWGLVDAPDDRTRTNYVKQMRWKRAQYHSNKLQFISIYPDNLRDLDRIFKSKFKKVTGSELH